LPIWSGQNTPLYVTDIIPQTHDVSTFRFQGDPLCRFVYKPGQFCSLVLNIQGKKVVRSYTISSSPTRPYALEITVKRVEGGVVSNWLHDNLKVGDRIEVSGPKGKFCLVPGQIPRKILLVGAGSGVTPALSMGHWLCDVSANVDVKFLNVVKSSNDMVCGQEIELMALRNKQLTVIHVASRGEGDPNWTGLTGRVSRAMLEKAIPDLHERHIYMCGPQPFMDSVRDILAEMKFELANLHTESFGGVRTSVVDKPVPLSGDGNVAEPSTDTAGALSIEFARTGKVVAADGRLPLLDLAEANDVELPYGCRTGNCGDCKVRLIKGEVTMSTEEGLSAAEKADGFILTCVGRPRTACTLDA
jgi:ferredoxin-NADP reductase